MRTAVAIALALTALPAAAVEPITLKGLAPGMTRAQLEAVHPGILGRCFPMPNDAGVEACGYPFTGLPRIAALDSFAGVSAKGWTIVLRGGAAQSISVRMAAEEFERVVAAVSERWGPPVHRAASVVRNRMGAQFDQVAARWRVGESVLLARKRSREVDTMALILGTDSAMAEMERQVREVRPKQDAKDM